MTPRGHLRGRESLAWPAAKLAAFVLVGVLAAVVVGNTLTVPVPGDTTHYSVVFTRVDGLTPGSDVTLTGVRVGRVDAVSFHAARDGRAEAVVDIEVRADTPLPSDVQASVRYGDMLGARYLALSFPAATVPAPALAGGARVPVERTTPPVDLTALVNGFKPLFEAIEPEQVNSLARTVVEAFQGEAATVATLLRRIAEVTANLNDHQAVFTQLVTNLNALLGAVDQRGAQVNQLITGLADLSGTVAGRNQQLITLLDDGSATVRTLVTLMGTSLAPLRSTVADLTATTSAWIPQTAAFTQTMRELPRLAASLNRMGDHGSWLNLYTCNFTVLDGTTEVNVAGPAHLQVCR